MVEGRAGDGARQRLGLAGTVFVRPSWLDDVRARGRPYLPADLVRRWLAGERPVLTPDEIRENGLRENLTVFFVCNALANRNLTDELRLAVNAEWSEVLYGLRSCSIDSMWIEVYGAKARDWIAGCGMRVKDDFARHWAENPSARPGPEEQPFLLGCGRLEARDQPGSHASFLFSRDHPVFGFTVRQQELLLRAVDGATDEDLARSLRVSMSAVKKRWIAIYDKVGAVMPGWLEAADGDATRGAEKRRHLLNHLREHPAELHPVNATRD
ncbi:hypothetical protein DB347_24510 [Opitutaceae bacterium EW11]|nr:hypothetical protein DB347_24510 [Opitutaceae bacterium EW11]